MLRTTTLRQALFTGFLVLLVASPVRLASAGADAWTSAGPYAAFVESLVIDPLTPTTVYAAAGGGVFKSTDGGGRWEALLGLPAEFGVHTLAVDPVTPGIVYAGTDGGGVFRMWQDARRIYLPLIVLGSEL